MVAGGLVAVPLVIASVWLTLGVAPLAACAYGVGIATFAVGTLAREVPGCPPMLAWFAPAVAFAGGTVQSLGRQAPSPSLLGAVLLTGILFGWQARRARRGG